jgi:hypothetical protein
VRLAFQWDSRQQFFNSPNMIGQMRCHSGRAGAPLTSRYMPHPDPQGLVRSHQVVIAVFPGSRSPVAVNVFGKGQRLAGLATVEQAAGQMAALDLSGAFSQ